jgi:polar amino acid transport system substrate-binding protein
MLKPLICAALLAFVATPAAALTFVTEEAPPYNFTEGGKVTGLSTQVLQEAGRRTGVPIRIEVLTWEQAYQRAQAKADTCVYSTVRLENRERLFRWIGPIASNRWGLFAKTGFAVPLKTLADARGLRIGAVKNDAKVEVLKENAVTNIVLFDEDRQIPPKLTLDRRQEGGVDLWIAGIYASRGVAAAAGVKDIKMVLPAGEVNLWLACNPAVPRETVDRLNKAIAAIREDGTFARIAELYDRKFAN